MYSVDLKWSLPKIYEDHIVRKEIGQAPTEAEPIPKESYTVLLIHISTLLLLISG